MMGGSSQRDRMASAWLLLRGTRPAWGFQEGGEGAKNWKGDCCGFLPELSLLGLGETQSTRGGFWDKEASGGGWGGRW